MIIKGNTVGTPAPRTDWNETNPKKSTYLKGKEDLDKKIQDAQDAADAAQTAADNAQTAADNAQTAADNAQTAAGNSLTSAQAYANEQVRKARPYNILINSDFRNPVNQRGQTTYTGNLETIDCWRAYHSDTVHTLTENGLKVTATSAPNAYQILDVNGLDTSKQYTAAACDSDGNIVIWTGSLKNTTGVAPICVYVSGESTLFRLSASKTWSWAALYEGKYTLDTIPGYQPKGRKVEELCCKYVSDYLLVENGMDVRGNFNVEGTAAIFKEKWPTLNFKNALGQNLGLVAIDTSTNRLTLGQQETGATYYEGYQLPAKTNGLTKSVFYEILTTKNFTLSTGNATIDSTNVSSMTELAYYKYGRIVIAIFDFTTTGTPSKLFAEFQMATGFPKPAVCGKHQATVLRGSTSRHDGVTWITSTGSLRIKSRDTSIESADICGTIVYIAES